MKRKSGISGTKSLAKKLKSRSKFDKDGDEEVIVSETDDIVEVVKSGSFSARKFCGLLNGSSPNLLEVLSTFLDFVKTSGDNGDEKSNVKIINNIDLLKDLCSVSHNGAELLQWLGKESVKPMEIHLILTIVEKIQLRIAGDDLSHLAPFGQRISRTLIGEGCITALLGQMMPNKPVNFVRQGFRTLTACVMQGGEPIAEEMVMAFKMDHPAIKSSLSRFQLEKRATFDDQDVRSAVLIWMSALLSQGSQVGAVKRLVEQPGVLNRFFERLYFDSAPVINTFLSVLAEKVLQASKDESSNFSGGQMGILTKTSKIKLFNLNILKKLVLLMGWQPDALPNLEPESLAVKVFTGLVPLSEEGRLVSNLVEEFIRQLTSSNQTGILFDDPLLGGGPDCRNPIILGLAGYVAKWARYGPIRSLLLDLLISSPDIFRFWLGESKTVWQMTGESVSPLHSSLVSVIVEYFTKTSPGFQSQLSGLDRSSNLNIESTLFSRMGLPFSMDFVLMKLLNKTHDFDLAFVEKVLHFLALLVCELDGNLEIIRNCAIVDHGDAAEIGQRLYLALPTPSALISFFQRIKSDLLKSTSLEICEGILQNIVEILFRMSCNCGDLVAEIDFGRFLSDLLDVAKNSPNNVFLENLKLKMFEIILNSSGSNLPQLTRKSKNMPFSCVEAILDLGFGRAREFLLKVLAKSKVLRPYLDEFDVWLKLARMTNAGKVLLLEILRISICNPHPFLADISCENCEISFQDFLADVLNNDSKTSSGKVLDGRFDVRKDFFSSIKSVISDFSKTFSIFTPIAISLLTTENCGAFYAVLWDVVHFYGLKSSITVQLINYLDRKSIESPVIKTFLKNYDYFISCRSLDNMKSFIPALDKELRKVETQFRNCENLMSCDLENISGLISNDLGEYYGSATGYTIVMEKLMRSLDCILNCGRSGEVDHLLDAFVDGLFKTVPEISVGIAVIETIVAGLLDKDVNLMKHLMRMLTIYQNHDDFPRLCRAVVDVNRFVDHLTSSVNFFDLGSIVVFLKMAVPCLQTNIVNEILEKILVQIESGESSDHQLDLLLVFLDRIMDEKFPKLLLAEESVEFGKKLALQVFDLINSVPIAESSVFLVAWIYGWNERLGQKVDEIVDKSTKCDAFKGILDFVQSSADSMSTRMISDLLFILKKDNDFQNLLVDFVVKTASQTVGDSFDTILEEVYRLCPEDRRLVILEFYATNLKQAAARADSKWLFRGLHLSHLKLVLENGCLKSKVLKQFWTIEEFLHVGSIADQDKVGRFCDLTNKFCKMKHLLPIAQSIFDKISSNLRWIDDNSAQLLVIDKLIELVSCVIDKTIDSDKPLLIDWVKWIDIVLNGPLIARPAWVRFLASGSKLWNRETSHKAVEQLFGSDQFGKLFFDKTESPDPLINLAGFLVQLAKRWDGLLLDTHVLLLLGAYTASLSEADTAILRVLHTAAPAMDFSKYSPLVWGTDGLTQYANLKKMGPSLWNRPTFDEVLDLIDPARMWLSVLHFPTGLAMLSDTSLDISLDEIPYSNAIYDPRFLLPLLASILGPECIVNGRKLMEKGCVGFLIACLSSHDQGVRGLAYLVLARYRGHLVSHAKFEGKVQMSYLLSLLKNTVVEPNQRLPCLIAIFLARAVRLMMTPLDHMNKLVQSFLLLKPSMDLDQIPEFYKLFNSSALEYRTERMWMLSLITDGLREPGDLWLAERISCLKLLLAYFNSPLSDSQSRESILDIMIRVANIGQSALTVLINGHNLIGWLCLVADSIIRGDNGQVFNSHSVQPNKAVGNCRLQFLKLIETVWNCALIESDGKLKLSSSKLTSNVIAQLVLLLSTLAIKVHSYVDSLISNHDAFLLKCAILFCRSFSKCVKFRLSTDDPEMRTTSQWDILITLKAVLIRFLNLIIPILPKLLSEIGNSVEIVKEFEAAMKVIVNCEIYLPGKHELDYLLNNVSCSLVVSAT